MSSPESGSPKPVASSARLHMDEFLAERPSLAAVPHDMQQLLCTIIEEVVTMSDANAEAASVAYNPERTFAHYLQETPALLKRDPDAWTDNARTDLRTELLIARFEHDLPMFLPHRAEGDYLSGDDFSLALCIAGPVAARCLCSLEGTYPEPLAPQEPHQ